METETNVVKEAITHLIPKNKVDTVNEINKPQASENKKDKPISNKSDKGRSFDKSISLDKSKSTQRTETEDTVTLNKSRSISSVSFSDKSARKQNPK